jgi:DNA-binding NtrC family response regulator
MANTVPRPVTVRLLSQSGGRWWTTENRATPHPWGVHMLVLVVDDEPTLRTVCQRLFSAMGHTCEAAADVAEVIELAKSHAFDLIVCDYRLGHETAEDVIAALQEVAPGLVGTIVVASGDGSGAEVANLVEEYGLGVICKPFGKADLEELVSERSS